MPLLEKRTFSFENELELYFFCAASRDACQSKLETSVYLKLNQGDYN